MVAERVEVLLLALDELTGDDLAPPVRLAVRPAFLVEGAAQRAELALELGAVCCAGEALPVRLVARSACFVEGTAQRAKLPLERAELGCGGLRQPVCLAACPAFLLERAAQRAEFRVGGRSPLVRLHPCQPLARQCFA